MEHGKLVYLVPFIKGKNTTYNKKKSCKPSQKNDRSVQLKNAKKVRHIPSAFALCEDQCWQRENHDKGYVGFLTKKMSNAIVLQAKAHHSEADELCWGREISQEHLLMFKSRAGALWRSVAENGGREGSSSHGGRLGSSRLRFFLSYGTLLWSYLAQCREPRKIWMAYLWPLH